jgi:hypothetical protein
MAIPTGRSGLAGEAVGQGDGSGAGGKVGLVLRLDRREVLRERHPERRRQHRHAIAAALAIPDAYLASLEIDVLDAQLAALEQGRPAP